MFGNKEENVRASMYPQPTGLGPSPADQRRRQRLRVVLGDQNVDDDKRRDEGREKENDARLVRVSDVLVVT
jgi:hypothetical protein